MEFCLSVPGKFRINNGISRHYYREALKSYLPAICKNRITKANISPLVVNYLRNNEHDVLESIKNSPVDDYIDIDFFEKRVAKPFSKGFKAEEYSQLVFQVYSLSQWLKKIE